MMMIEWLYCLECAASIFQNMDLLLDNLLCTTENTYTSVYYRKLSTHGYSVFYHRVQFDSADHMMHDDERDWPPCKVPDIFFRVGNQYAECEKQKKKTLFSPLTGGCSEGLDAFRFSFKAVVNTVGGLLASGRVFCWLPFVFFCS